MMREPTGVFERDDETVVALQQFGEVFPSFMLNYRFAINEIETKLNILKQEFEYLHDYSPIEHLKSRLKSVDSIVAKARLRGIEYTPEAIGASMRDIAGVRVVCSFVSDAYAVADMLAAQADITVVEVKDYIAHPKPNGYKSLHLVVTVPIFLSGSVEDMYVELQIRTVAMDFWASLEHKIYYKYGREIPAHLLKELTEAAATASRLDEKMARIHSEVRALAPPADDE
ncbi:GTP pyrophosphokinase [Demequina aurantiaca]|uniref:GTP pyrophosphokinase n=1 Tax=Demequina aurantiaca TaxID=676200 RepID=UPI003D335415